MTISLYLHRTNAVEDDFTLGWWGPRFGFHFNNGATMKELNFHEKKKIRNRLLAIYEETGKVTERDLLRLSALTGIAYAAIVEIHKCIDYRIQQGLKEHIKGKIANSK